MNNNAKIIEFNSDRIVIEFNSGIFEMSSEGNFTWTSNNNMPTYDELYEHWLKTKDKPKKKHKPEQLPGQLDLFDIIDVEAK